MIQIRCASKYYFVSLYILFRFMNKNNVIYVIVIDGIKAAESEIRNDLKSK